MLCLSGFELYSRWVPLSGEPVFIDNNNKTFKGREGWELQNFRTVELLQLSNTAQNATQDFY